MVEKDIIAVKSAIESMKASNWANKDEKIKQLEENLDPQYDEIPKGIDSTGYEDAQRLIKSSNWDESEKERVLKLLSEINDAEQVEEREGQQARTAAIQKMIATDPSFFAIARSISRALKSGVISEDDAYKLLSYALETEGLKS
jgi:molecular chaperone GrpE (heat shock protein)